MDFFFNPDGIAVVGATPNPFKGGNAILKNLIAGYTGGIYPVNPQYSEIEALTCFPSVRAIPEQVDLAIVFVPAKKVPATIEDCIAKGVPGVMIESGGFAETGLDGTALQQSLKNMVSRSGIRLWGPNCMGLVDAYHDYVFSFMAPGALEHGLLRGNISLVVQSGLLSAGFLIDIMNHYITGISKVCSIGNKVDVNECDLMPHLLQDTNTKVVGLYLESFSDGRLFADLCRRSDKPIVLLYGGKSRKGAEAAISHTASLAGNQRVISGVLAQAGVIEATDFKQMIDICRSLAATEAHPERPGRVAILTFSGGAGIVSSDFIEKHGLSVAELSLSTKETLKGLFPEWMPVSNPVDLWPAMERHAGSRVDVYGTALKAVLRDPSVDSVFVHTYAGNIRIKLDIADLAEQSKTAGKPAFVWLLGSREEAFAFKKEALAHGIPVFDELSRGIECLATVFHHRKPPEMQMDLSEREDAGTLSRELTQLLENSSGPLDEHLSKNIIKSYGIPTVEEYIVNDATECEAIAVRIGFPVVAKGLLPQAVHKTERGLIHLGIHNTQTVLTSFNELMNKMNNNGKVLIQKYLKGSVELIAGLIRDSQFGTCVMLGIGGVMTEVFNDVVFAMAPLTERNAFDLTTRLRNQKILDGYRGESPVNRKALAEILVRLGNIGLMHPRISEIDINPLIISEGVPKAVDATIVLQ
jgi:acetyltransferase